MERMAIIRFAALCLCSLGVACDRAPQPASSDTPAVRADSATVTSAVPAAVGEPGAPCPRTGRWALCSLEKRLEQSGFVAKKAEGTPTRRSGFTVQPVVYTLARARLEVFLYPDEAALNRDVTKLDTALAAARGQNNDWEIPPRFVRSGNLAAVLLTRNEQLADRLTLSITAGPPQSDP